MIQFKVTKDVGRDRKKHFEKAFAAGQLDELLTLTSEEAASHGALPVAILAQAAFGDWSKAQWHHRWARENKIKFDSVESARVNYALGVGHTRISEYAVARKHFARNFRYRRDKPKARFFCLLGIGFFRYFCGDYRRSAKYARQALEQASQQQDVYGQFAAEELLAHALTEAGEVRLGIKHMRRSLQSARTLNHKSLRQSTRLMLLLNEARFGLTWETIPALEQALRKLHPQDGYSRNAVKLELANQWVLRGQASKALVVLDEACDSIYANQNRRQIAQLNFRLAFLTWLRGRNHEALHLLKSAELHLHKDVDRSLWRHLEALRERIRRSGDSVVYDKTIKNPAAGEDRIADLFGAVAQKDSRALKVILEHRLLFFLYPYYGLKFDQKALLFDILPRGAIVINEGDIMIVENGFSRVNRQVLEALAASHQSKRELIETVWGYDYEGERHDALVYTSISKIRQLLGSAGVWIEGDEKGYRLRSGVVLEGREHYTRSIAEHAVVVPATRPPPVKDTTLSFRQLRILSVFDSDQVVAVDKVMRDFSVSRATATRDLSQLTKMGYLRRLGQARATKYVLSATDFGGTK